MAATAITASQDSALAPIGLDVTELAERLQFADLDEARKIHSFAAGFSTVLQKRRDAAAVQVDAAEVVLWAERRLGEFCRDREKATGGQPYQRSTGDGVSLVPTLAELGISKMQSHRWQKFTELITSSVPKTASRFSLAVIQAGWRLWPCR